MNILMDRKNIVWINNIKAICIISVLFIHCQIYYNYFLGCSKFIHPFYVNAFFFISGYLLFRKQMSEQLINQRFGEYVVWGGKTPILNIIYRLAMPTILFSIIEFFPSHILRGHEFDLSSFLYKTIGGCTYWFTAALVVAEFFILLLLLTRKKNMGFYAIASCFIALGGYYPVNNDISISTQYSAFPWMYKYGMYALLFMALGGVYWSLEDVINKLMDKTVLVGMILLYTVIFLLYPENFRVLISMLDVNISGIVASMLSVLILIELCKLLPKTKFLDYVGRNTLGFYFMSGALPIVLSLAAHKLMPESNIIGLIFVFIVSVAIAFAAVYLINRFIPWVFDLRLLWKEKE